MLRRKILDRLSNWKRKGSSKFPLVVGGARQVGKTTSIMQFARENYDCVFNLDFIEHPGFSAIFEGSLDPGSILNRLSFHFPSQRLLPSRTLIFLDEIQACPNARTALKFLAGDERFDVIASGSLLGLNYQEVRSFPVGYTEELEMTSMDFEEFLWAMGYTDSQLAMLRECYERREPVDSHIHKIMLDFFRQYMVIGGMPKVVATYASTGDYASSLALQRGIVSGYRSDIIKYLGRREKTKVVSCFNSIPGQLAKDHKKFQFSMVEKGSGARKFGGALNWLNDASVVSFCHNLSLPSFPFAGFRQDNDFKVYFRDTGLLVSMYETDTARRVMSGELGIYKGALYENIVAESLTKNGRPLYYFSPSSGLEIDFVIDYQGMPTAVEVKSGENNRSKSLNAVISNNRYEIASGIRLSSRNVGQEGAILSLPLYMAFMI